MNVRLKFRSAIRRGTGEAHLIMMINPNVNYSSDIIKASLKNYSYDNQSEGSRAVYLFELIKLSKQKEKIKKKLIQGLFSEKKDTWALDQLYDLLLLFAKEGDEEARKAIYKRFSEKPIEGSEWLGEDSIIELDGLKGLVFVAERKGKNLLENRDDWEDSFLVDTFQKNNPHIKVVRELQKKARINKNIKTYLDVIAKNKFEKSLRKRQKYNYEIVTERIRTKQFVPLPPAGAKDLSKSDIIRLADDFKKSKLRFIQEKYLRVFDKVKYPYNYKDLLVQAKRHYINKDGLVEYAVNSLRFFKHSEIRRFAIDKLIHETRNPEIYTNLLISNYKKGDGKLLAKIVERTKSPHKIHNLVWSYIEIYQANKTKDCNLPLIALYNKLTCGIHRCDIIEILKKNNVVPRKILNEIKYDSYLETRELVD